MRAKAQVDAQHMAVTGARRQDFDHPPRDPYRRFVGIVARAPRQRFGVEDQDRVDIRRIVELKAAELAERDHREARSEEHTSELQSLMRISYAVFCLKKKNQ